MKGITIQVGGGKKKPLMEAKISDDGTSIDISHCDGKKATIQLGPGEEICLAGPSVDASVMYVQLTSGREQLFDTRTGGPYQRKRGVNPQFYM